MNDQINNTKELEGILFELFVSSAIETIQTSPKNKLTAINDTLIFSSRGRDYILSSPATPAPVVSDFLNHDVFIALDAITQKQLEEMSLIHERTKQINFQMPKIEIPFKNSLDL